MSFHKDKNKNSLGHIPASDRWVFDRSVTDVFEDMLRRSIPQYGVMRNAVYDIGIRFVQPRTHIVDLGCSRGDALAPFVATYGRQNFYLGTDASEPMLEVAKARFKEQIDEKFLRVAAADLTEAYPCVVDASLTLCILTLQFVSPQCRAEVLRSIYRSTLAGGALIFVEKVVGDTRALDEMMVDLYYKLKMANGYSLEEIERKRRSLEGVLIPLSSKSNMESLANAGFQEVDCFWRWMNFAGYVAVKR